MKWVSYGDIAKVIGSAAQPVGNYIAAQKIPNAHRVLRSAGRVSESFFLDRPERDAFCPSSP